MEPKVYTASAQKYFAHMKGAIILVLMSKYEILQILIMDGGGGKISIHKYVTQPLSPEVTIRCTILIPD